MSKNIQTTSAVKPHLSAVALVTIAVLLVPLIAMQFTDEVQWDVANFALMGILLFTVGFMVDLVARKAGQYRAIIIFGIVLIFLYIWTELAVGIFTSLGS